MKAHKRQRWLCSDPGKRNIFIVEVLVAKRNGRVDLKVVQLIKGNIVKVGQRLEDEIFSPEHDQYLTGQDAAIN